MITDAAVWLRAFRHRILNLLLTVLTGLGTVGMVLTVIQHLRLGRVSLLLAYYSGGYLTVLILLLVRRIPDRLRAILLLILFYVFSIFVFITGWLGGGGRQFLLAFIVLAAILLGSRAGLHAALLSLFTYTAFSIVYYRGWLVYAYAPAFADLNVILIEGIGFAMSVGMISVALWFFDEVLKAANRVIHESQRARRMLDQRARELDTVNRLLAERTLHLEAANRELEAFSYSVSHDLRAPLRAIEGYSRVLVEDFASQLSQEGHSYLGKIIQSTTRMGMIIDDLLKLSRVSRAGLDTQPVQLSTLAQEVIASLCKDDPSRVVDVSIQPDMIVEGDLNLLRIALENLIGNAWKFTAQTAGARIEIGVQDGEMELVHFVRDNGAGFDMAYSDKLFGIFQRLHREEEFEGTGVGLAIVKRVVERHGGRVWFEAQPGRGAVFYFSLG